MQQPKLRFKGFSESWSKVELESIAEGITSGKSNFISKSIDSVNKIPVLGSTGIIGYRAEAEYKGDFVLIARVGANAGKVNFYSGEVGISDNTIYLQPKKGNDFKFLLNYLYSIDLNKLSFGSGQPLIKSSELKKLKVYAPSLSEQKKISSFYTLLNQRIEKQHEKLEKLEQFKKSMMQKIFSQELRFKDVDGLDFEDWIENVKAKELFKSISNKNHLGDLPVLSASQEKGIVMRDSNNIQIQFSVDNLVNYKKVEPDDFIISLRSFQGGIEFSQLLGIMSPAYTIFRAINNEKIYSPYFSFLFKTTDFITKLNNLTYGIRDGKAISFTDFSSMTFNVPSIEEQKKIADYLSVIDKKIKKEIEKLMMLEEQKKGFMQGIFV